MSINYYISVNQLIMGWLGRVIDLAAANLKLFVTY